MIQMLSTMRAMRTMYAVEARSDAIVRRLAATLAKFTVAAVLLTACGSESEDPDTYRGPSEGSSAVIRWHQEDRDRDSNAQASSCNTADLHGFYTMTLVLRDCGVAMQQEVYCGGTIESCDVVGGTSSVTCLSSERIDYDALSCYEQTATTCWGPNGEYLTNMSATHTATGAYGNMDVVYFELGQTCTGTFELVKS